MLFSCFILFLCFSLGFLLFSHIYLYMRKKGVKNYVKYIILYTFFSHICPFFLFFSYFCFSLFLFSFFILIYYIYVYIYMSFFPLFSCFSFVFIFMFKGVWSAFVHGINSLFDEILVLLLFFFSHLASGETPVFWSFRRIYNSSDLFYCHFIVIQYCVSIFILFIYIDSGFMMQKAGIHYMLYCVWLDMIWTSLFCPIISLTS